MTGGLVYYYKKSKMAGHLVGCLGFAVACLYLLVSEDVTSQDYWVVPLVVVGGMVAGLFAKLKPGSQQTTTVVIMGVTFSFIALIAMLFGAVGIWMIGLIFFGGGGLFLFYKAFVSPKPLLRLTQQGIEIDANMLIGKISLSWPEVSSLNVAQMPLIGHKKPMAFIAVHAKDWIAVQVRYPRLKSKMSNKLSIGLVGSPLSIPINDLNVPAGRLISEVAQFSSQHDVVLKDIQPTSI